MNKHNNLIANPATIYANERLETAAVPNARSSFNFARTTVSENSIRTPWRNFARRVAYSAYAAIQVILLHELREITRDTGIFPRYIMVRAFRIVISICDPILDIIWTRILARVIRECGAFTRRYRFHLFRNVARNTFRPAPFLSTFSFAKFVSVPYSRGKNSRMWKCSILYSTHLVGTFRRKDLIIST